MTKCMDCGKFHPFLRSKILVWRCSECLEKLKYEELWEKAKEWFGDGEADVELMVRMDVITKERVIEMYLAEN